MQRSEKIKKINGGGGGAVNHRNMEKYCIWRILLWTMWGLGVRKVELSVKFERHLRIIICFLVAMLLYQLLLLFDLQAVKLSYLPESARRDFINHHTAAPCQQVSLCGNLTAGGIIVHLPYTLNLSTTS